MFSEEFKTFLIQVLTSWQVIVAVLVVILYITLVSYAARFHRRISISTTLPVKKRSKDKQAPATGHKEDDDGKNKKNKKK